MPEAANVRRPVPLVASRDSGEPEVTIEDHHPLATRTGTTQTFVPTYRVDDHGPRDRSAGRSAQAHTPDSSGPFHMPSGGPSSHGSMSAISSPGRSDPSASATSWTYSKQSSSATSPTAASSRSSWSRGSRQRSPRAAPGGTDSQALVAADRTNDHDERDRSDGRSAQEAASTDLGDRAPVVAQHDDVRHHADHRDHEIEDQRRHAGRYARPSRPFAETDL
jgi:hypothetical protein